MLGFSRFTLTPESIGLYGFKKHKRQAIIPVFYDYNFSREAAARAGINNNAYTGSGQNSA